MLCWIYWKHEINIKLRPARAKPQLYSARLVKRHSSWLVLPLQHSLKANQEVNLTEESSRIQKIILTSHFVWFTPSQAQRGNEQPCTPRRLVLISHSSAASPVLTQPRGYDKRNTGWFPLWKNGRYVSKHDQTLTEQLVCIHQGKQQIAYLHRSNSSWREMSLQETAFNLRTNTTQPTGDICSFSFKLQSVFIKIIQIWTDVLKKKGK